MARNDGPTASSKTEAQLAEFAAQFYADPYGFVMIAYPWGQPTLPDGSVNDLADKDGPEAWQRRILQAVGRHIVMNRDWQLLDVMNDPFIWRSARASGHGVGKSALVAWLVQFFMATRRDTRGVVTANTQNQLETKTWPELAKWHRRFLFRHWFEWTATSYYFKAYPEDQRKNYIVNALTVSPENTEAFAGLHNEGKCVFVIFDEASGIESKVWEVADGALTDGEGFFFAFGNPTKPEGAFADCFGRHSALFNLEHIDSREVRHTNKNALNDIIRKYGADSDEAKVRVYGQFPSQAFNGFLSVDGVKEAMERELQSDNQAALIMSVDVARFGDDESVIFYRQGRDARSRKPKTFKGLSTTKLAKIVADEFMRERPDAVVIEGTGVGAGVIDTLRDTYHIRVKEVHPGAPSSEVEHWVNLRAELWGKMRDWMYEGGGCIYDDGDDEKGLFGQLTKMQYGYDRRETKIMLESKEAFKSRTGIGSPDRADALALTFAIKLPRRDANNTRYANRLDKNQAVVDYDEHAY